MTGTILTDPVEIFARSCRDAGTAFKNCSRRPHVRLFMALCVDSGIFSLNLLRRRARFVAVFINLADSDIRATISSGGDEDLENLEIVDLQNNKYSCGQEVTVPQDGYVKVVRKNG